MAHRITRDIDRLITEALAIEAESARDAGQLGFMCRAMAQATMPHRRYKGGEFTRRNGLFVLSMLAPEKIGLPYGSIPRLLVSWITTEAVKTRERELILGDNLSAFLSAIGIERTGGKRGGITRLKRQMQRLFSASVTCTYTGDEIRAGSAFTVADKWALWWDPKMPTQGDLWRSNVRLSERFFEEITQNPVPVDMRALRAIRRSPMALDVYTWLTYRMSYLKRRTVIPWVALQAQFGSDYTRTRDFKRHFAVQLHAVLTVYPSARVDTLDDGLELRPSPPHVGRG